VAAFVEGLITAGFTITATWPLKDVRSSAVFGGEAGTGFRSIYFVCRLRVESCMISRRDFLALLKSRMPTALVLYRTLDRTLEANDCAYAAVAAGLRIYSDYMQVLNADGSRFAVADAIEEILRIAEEIKAGERVEDVQKQGLAKETLDALARGEDSAVLRRRVYEAYLKAEDSGRTQEAAEYNDLLNRWNDLIEEIQK
jgi:adenine-specific DNA methylase